MLTNRIGNAITKLLFLAGVSPLASVMDVPTKLRLAFEVFDYQETGTMSRDNMESVIGGNFTVFDVLPSTFLYKVNQLTHIILISNQQSCILLWRCRST